MFGAFRYLLAVCVLVSHIWPMKFQIGVSAVVGFFIISGYVMNFLLSQYQSVGKVRFFYVDRLLRILPQYYFYLVLSQAALFFMKFVFFSGYFPTEFSPWAFLLNALLVPVNYYFWIPQIEAYLLIPQAWSLGLEEQFYLLFPLIFVSHWFRRAAIVLSLILFAVAANEYLPVEVWTYRVLPGVFFIFVLGSSWASYRRSGSKEGLVTAILVYLAVLGLFSSMYDRANMEFGKNREILVGILVNFPVIAILSYLPRKKWDEFVGKASYGIFLNHVLVFNFLQNYDLFMESYWRHTAGGIVVSTVLAYMSYYLVEIISDRFRHKIRTKVLKRESKNPAGAPLT